RVRSLRAGDGYLSQSTRFMHFGLGDSDEVCVVEVVWPDGQVERYEDLTVDRIWRLVQGAGHAVEVKREQAVSMAGAPTSAIGMSESEARRIVLIDRLPMSAFPLPSYDRPERSVADFEGGPTLINLWGLSCANCFKELAEFRDASDRLQAAGLRVVPLSTDPVEQQDRAREVIGKLGHGVLAGPTDPKQYEALQLLFSEILGASAPSYLPSSLLLDAQGRVCVVYQGPVSVETLLNDVASIGRMRADNRFTGQLESGRWLATRTRGFRGLAQGLRAAGHGALADFYDKLATRDAAMRR
ncbi:MAG: ASPIC/UnbV domain-containing protein, partial [Planctomycetes bacterium]|nr:ASPIC/UnbV domain-containing protein [Planctomycetota bacterium]